MLVFKEFDRSNNPINYFHINTVPLAVEFPEENDIEILEYTPNTNPQETIIQANTNLQTKDTTPKNPTIEKDAIPEVDDDSDEVDSSDVESDYEYQPSEPVSDSDISLVESLVEGNVMGGIPGRCDPDGDKFCWDNSSDEEDGSTNMTLYCIRNKWTSNPDGFISLRAGQIFSNSKEVKNVIRRFAIQEGR
ncbi:hypothetical protein Ddye_021084 [Dipteronia dyeriana]|uniref:Uncharacterized protein n=1 Tax=Dipteronia dyeriana TaxID=168575 RepID=A0AAD9U211_9ROSI|nr:hypothetical protein Ddye_021084 [Dipteronia dyeriana]